MITLNATTILILIFTIATTTCQKDDVIRIFKKCSKSSLEFDSCLMGAFNDSIAYYKTGIPELGIAPFDPHRLELLEDHRKTAFGSYSLVVTEIAEYGWSNSRLVKLETDADINRLVYTQTFPYKYLNGKYDFKMNAFGKNNIIHSAGSWNVTLYNYTQTTAVSRVGAPGTPLKVRLTIDSVEKIDTYCSDEPADILFRAIMTVGFPLAKPGIDDLISKAFTIIFNRSFGAIDVNDFVSE